MADFGDSFSVEATAGQVVVRGSAAIPVLLRIALAAKFPDEPNPDILFSPYVNGLIDELTTITRAELREKLGARADIDWESPHIGVSGAFLKVADVVRQMPADRLPGGSFESAMAVATNPYPIPLRRLERPAREVLTDLDLDRLEDRERPATPAPWSARGVAHDGTWTGVAIECRAEDGAAADRNLIATFPFREPPDAVSHRADINASLLCDVRNVLPELIRLARIGLETERAGAEPSITQP